MQSTAQQISAVYELESPSGYRFVVNDELDADFVGVLDGPDSLTGLDSPEVRAHLYEKVQTDGSIAGPFFHGIRPITMTVSYHEPTIVERNATETKLHQVLNDCMTGDGTLTWTPSGSIEQRVRVRKQQPLRTKGGWNKQALVGLVAASPLIESTDPQTLTLEANALGVATNDGSDPAPPTFRIFGPGTGPVIKNVTTGRNLAFTKGSSLVLTAGQFVDVNVLNATAVRDDGTNVYSFVNFPTQSDWWTLMPGDNSVRCDWTSGTTAASDFQIDWRHTWL